MCPYIAASVEIHDPQHPARQYAHDYKKAFAARLAETAREAGATNPEQLGEQLALVLDGASARTRVLNTESFPTAAAIAAVLIDNAIPSPAMTAVTPLPESAPARAAGERPPGQASSTGTKMALASSASRCSSAVRAGPPSPPADGHCCPTPVPPWRRLPRPGLSSPRAPGC